MLSHLPYQLFVNTDVHWFHAHISCFWDTVSYGSLREGVEKLYKLACDPVK
jgi:hypothetical protein